MFCEKPNKLPVAVSLNLTVSILGCTVHRPEVVILSDVPKSPSFPVIPANDFLYKVEFANSVEDAIISAGVKVVVRPSTKQVNTETRGYGVEGGHARSDEEVLAAGGKLTERFLTFVDIQVSRNVSTIARPNLPSSGSVPVIPE